MLLDRKTASAANARPRLQPVVIMIVNLRHAQMEDIPALEDLILDSVSVLSLPYYTAKQISSALAHVFGPDTQLILDGTYFVAEADNQIAGSGGWSKRKTLFGGDQAKSPADPLLDPAKDAARIRAFYVHPRWARKGVATKILTACEAERRTARHYRLFAWRRKFSRRQKNVRSKKIHHR